VNNPENGWVITLDGPAGSGKSTTARLVADSLNFVYLDTGALYRAVTVLALSHGVAPDDAASLEALVAASGVQVEREDGLQRIRSGSKDLTLLLRSAEVERHVSAISAVPEVRQAMLHVQRAQQKPPGLVAEGRDLGTVVFPDAHLKIYMIADLEVRAQRRAKERQASGQLATVEAERESLARRDRLDSGRQVAPLRQPEGAHVVDTSRLSIQEQAKRVVDLFREAVG
jgi:cytidylate kinase